MTNCEFGDERLPQRFWDKVRVSDGGCWEWTANITHKGYSLFWWAPGMAAGHRLAYKILVGDPGPLVLDHLCRVRHCVNPAHLEPVTPLENTRRGLHGSEPACPHGHPYSPENTYIDKRGSRNCRECSRESGRRYKARKRAERDPQTGA